MGGGVGVSIPGTFRIASGRTVFENPETLTGFHPDPGASFYLPHLPGRLGEYLALTWEKLNAAEMMACGLATHYSLSEEREGAETNDAWCSSTLRRLKEASPLSLKVSLRSVRYEKVDLRPLIKAWSVNTECHYKGYLSKFLVIFVREFVHECWTRTLPQRLCSGVFQVWSRYWKMWLIAIFPYLVKPSLI
ncbi:3-hydroxyisobutyryl-CoA hydrolase-like protein 1, mitochondrial isoform X3 [Pistacia vera]|uniref:3-hydroxyisobutyryl-CoA hydrolase-like protein 1, mitochondrial isoform X3 n=1 Tax=Pistacia vera TaxID=55513 RepID=UPI001263AE70|nr:3-hydroxyisobutyryl-CoA hydrolase-like protein 1, mitochondrial isoform X3 [Pistacia vera]